MDDHGDSATEHGVGSKLCTMPHAVVSAITSNSNSLTDSFHFCQQLGLIFFPVDKDGGKQLALKYTYKQYFSVKGQVNIYLYRAVI